MMIRPNVRAPSTSRMVNKLNGGIISNTTLLTTYMPPQMEAAARPARIPTICDLFIIASRCLPAFILGPGAGSFSSVIFLHTDCEYALRRNITDRFPYLCVELVIVIYFDNVNNSRCSCVLNQKGLLHNFNLEVVPFALQKFDLLINPAQKK